MPPQRRRINGHEKKIVAARQAWKCKLCEHLLDETFEVDHVIPLHVGGDDDINNCRALCPNCHRKITVQQEAERIKKNTEEVLAAAAARGSCLQRDSSRANENPGSQSLPSSSLYCPRCGRTLSPYFVHSRSSCNRIEEDSEKR